MRIALGFALALALGATAQEKKNPPIDAKKLVGKWELKDAKKGTKPPQLEFAADGKLALTGDIDGKPANFTGTYKLDGDKLSFELKSKDDAFKDAVTLTRLDDDEFDAKDADGKTETFARVKAKK
jgi:uncharacterized protein (TIGR03066 family)